MTEFNVGFHFILYCLPIDIYAKKTTYKINVTKFWKQICRNVKLEKQSGEITKLVLPGIELTEFDKQPNTDKQ